jgi:hypothetical protein
MMNFFPSVTNPTQTTNNQAFYFSIGQSGQANTTQDPLSEPDKTLHTLQLLVKRASTEGGASRKAARILEEIGRTLQCLRRESLEDEKKTWHKTWEGCAFHSISYSLRAQQVKALEVEMTKEMWEQYYGPDDDPSIPDEPHYAGVYPGSILTTQDLVLGDLLSNASTNPDIIDVRIPVAPYGLDGFQGIEKRLSNLDSEAKDFLTLAKGLEGGLKQIELNAEESFRTAKKLRTEIPATRDHLLRVVKRFDTYLLGRDVVETTKERELRDKLEELHQLILTGADIYNATRVSASLPNPPNAALGGLHGRIRTLKERVRMWEDGNAVLAKYQGALIGDQFVKNGSSLMIDTETEDMIQKRLAVLQKGIERLAERVMKNQRHCVVAGRELTKLESQRNGYFGGGLGDHSMGLEPDEQLN